MDPPDFNLLQKNIVRDINKVSAYRDLASILLDAYIEKNPIEKENETYVTGLSLATSPFFMSTRAPKVSIPPLQDNPLDMTYARNTGNSCFCDSLIVAMLYTNTYYDFLILPYPHGVGVQNAFFFDTENNRYVTKMRSKLEEDIGLKPKNFFAAYALDEYSTKPPNENVFESIRTIIMESRFPTGDVSRIQQAIHKLRSVAYHGTTTTQEDPSEFFMRITDEIGATLYVNPFVYEEIIYKYGLKDGTEEVRVTKKLKPLPFIIYADGENDINLWYELYDTTYDSVTNDLNDAPKGEDKHFEPGEYDKFKRTIVRSLIRLPKHIMVHISRGMGENQKSDTKVKAKLGDIIALSPNKMDYVHYEVVSFIKHIGSTINSGHYVTYFKRNNRNYFYDDIGSGLEEAEPDYDDLQSNCVMIGLQRVYKSNK